MDTDHELMVRCTWFSIRPGISVRPLPSKTTAPAGASIGVASMRDLGYVVNYDAGDTFAGSLIAMLREINSVPTRINEVVMLPTTSVDVQGVTRPINRR